MTGSDCGRAQSSVAASGTTSSASPWTTTVSAGTGGTLWRLRRRPDQHQPLRRASPQAARRAPVRRRSRRRRSPPAAAAAPRHRRAARGGDHRQCIVDLAAPLVPGAFGGADAAEVEAHAAPAELHEGARQRLHHLVVHRAAEAADADGTITATPRGAAGRARRCAHSIAPGGPVDQTGARVCEFISGRRPAAAAAARPPGRSSGASRRSRRCRRCRR